MARVQFDETFMELTLDDIRDSIEKIAQSRAEQPKPIETWIAYGSQRIRITVERLPRPGGRAGRAGRARSMSDAR